MITTYDLDSFADIGIADPPSMYPVTDPDTCTELRLEPVALASSRQVSRSRVFSAVICQQVLAQL